MKSSGCTGRACEALCECGHGKFENLKQVPTEVHPTIPSTASL